MSVRFLTAIFLLASASLSATGIVELTGENYKKFIESADKPVIIKVYASWCQPCQLMNPVFEQFAQENDQKFLCAELNNDTAREISQSLQITALPTFVIIANKQEVGKIKGMKTKEALSEEVAQALNNAGKGLSELPKEVLNEKFADAIFTNAPASRVKEIIEAGIDVNALLKGNVLPLIVALNNAFVSDEAIAVVALLVEKGALTKHITFPWYPEPIDAADMLKMMLVNTKKTVEHMHTLLSLFEKSDS
jgi:thioredoxin